MCCTPGRIAKRQLLGDYLSSAHLLANMVDENIPQDRVGRQYMRQPATVHRSPQADPRTALRRVQAGEELQW